MSTQGKQAGILQPPEKIPLEFIEFAATRVLLQLHQKIQQQDPFKKITSSCTRDCLTSIERLMFHPCGIKYQALRYFTVIEAHVPSIVL